MATNSTDPESIKSVAFRHKAKVAETDAMTAQAIIQWMRETYRDKGALFFTITIKPKK